MSLCRFQCWIQKCSQVGPTGCLRGGRSSHALKWFPIKSIIFFIKGEPGTLSPSKYVSGFPSWKYIVKLFNPLFILFWLVEQEKMVQNKTRNTISSGKHLFQYYLSDLKAWSDHIGCRLQLTVCDASTYLWGFIFKLSLISHFYF